MKKNTHGQNVNRRNFLRVESLEPRLALATMAVNDTFHAALEEPLNVSAPGVLANDIGESGQPLTASLFSGPVHGVLNFNADGSFIYTPAAGFEGLDSFVYAVADGPAQSLLAAVTIEVSNETAPVSANDAYSLSEDEPLAICAVTGLLSNDDSAAGASVALVSGPASGALTLHSDGGFVYVPAANFTGEVSFTYQATNLAGLGNEATVTLTIAAVNDVPVAANDSFTVNEDQPLVVATSLLMNDTDIENSPLTAELMSQPMHGSVTFNPNGTFNYQPQANFNGLDGFSYLVNDGTDHSSVATVTIRVNPINDTPVAENDEYTIDEDSPLSMIASGVLGNDTDLDNANLTATLVAAPLHGAVTLNADGSFVYTPAANFSGVDGFSYEAGDGFASSDVAAVTINVSPVNDAPLGAADAFTVAEDSTLTITSGGVLANDTDVDTASLTATMGTSPTHGSVILASDGTFIYTPNADFNGEDSFSYTAGDGEFVSSETVVTITVTPENDKPMAADDAYMTDENQPLQIAAAGVLSNDCDIDGDVLTAGIITGPANGTLALTADGSFLYTPNAGFAGTDTFTYAAADGTDAATAIVTITVNDVIQPPITNADAFNVGEDLALDVSAAWGVLANDFDPQSMALSAELVTPPAHGQLVLDSSGAFRYTPDANFHGNDSFTYRAINAAGEMTEGTASIVVETINDAPTSSDDSFSVAAGGVLQTIAATGVQANDSDIDSSSLTAKLLQGPTHGTLVFAADGSFTYTPAANYAGSDEFIYQLNDGMANSQVAHATIAITPSVVLENTRPVVHNDHYELPGDVPFTVPASGILANDTDAENDALIAQFFGGPQHGTVVLNTDGGFTYTPEAGYVGTDSFLYWASDGLLNSSLAAVTLRVSAVPAVENAPPTMIVGEGDPGDDAAAFDCVLTAWA